MTDFTPEQKQAIEYRPMDACVVAGPGSGKTTVLVERYRALVEKHRIPPDHILAITFTEKAAANMKARLARQFEHDEKLLRDLERGWVSTIHAFCARVLKENAIAAGIDPRFTVLDAGEAEQLQSHCLNAALDQLTEERRDEILALIRVLKNPELNGDLLSVWDAIRSSGKSIGEVRGMEPPFGRKTGADFARRLRELVNAWPARLTPAQNTQKQDLLEFAERLGEADRLTLPEWLTMSCRVSINLGRVPMSEREALRTFRESLVAMVDARTTEHRALVFDILDRFESVYAERKAERGVLDFDDLEKRTVAMLESNAAVRDRLRKQFRQVMLDEFQDINDQQARLIELIRSDDVFFAVGDINQSIYGFRHARPEIFRGYERQIREDRKQYARLLNNFRSHDGILRCVETVLHGAEGIEYRELIAQEEPKDNSPAVEISRVMDEDDQDSGEREARWIAYRILELREEHRYEFRDFAVLCRNRDSMKPILAAFDMASIPYVCGHRDSVLSAREGRDLTALLSVISNPRDTVSLATVLRSPLVGLSDEGLLGLRMAGSSISSGLNAVAHAENGLAGFSGEDAHKLERFTWNLRRWRLSSGTMPLDLLLTTALADCDYVWAPGTVAGDSVEAFLKIVRTRGANRGLLDLLRELEALENAFDAEAELSDEDQGDQVQVMTAHAAKGLEFPVTIIAAMQKGVQRDSRSISFTPEHGLGIRWASPVSTDGAKDSWHFKNGERLKEREKEEGNRLLYVAMTRAEKRLILSWSCREHRGSSNWASMVEKVFDLKDKPACDPRIESKAAVNGAMWTALVRITAEDPPHANARMSVRAAEVMRIERPPAADRSESSIAVTSVALFGECPRKYYLARYAGWSGRRRGRPDFADDSEEDAIDEPELSATELGTEVHDVLAEKPGDYSEQALKLAQVFRQSPLAARLASAVRIAREWEFIASVQGMFVRGSIDLWFEEPDGSITIVDYKTDDVTAAEAQQRARTYGTQLAIYAIALESAMGARPMRAFLHFLKPDSVVEIAVADGEMGAARHLVHRVRSAQNELRFDLHEGDQCRSCAYYRELCPAPLASAAS